MIIGFFTIMYTAKYLGVKGFGVLSFALAFTGYFGVLMDVGLPTLIIREVARNKELAATYIKNIVFIKIILAVVILSLIAIIINLQKYPNQTVLVIYIIALYVAINSFCILSNSIFQAFENMEYQSVSNIFKNTFVLIGILFVINRDLGIVELTWVYPVSVTLVLIYDIMVLSKIIPNLNATISRTFCRSLIIESIPFGIIGISSSVYTWTTTIMLFYFKGEEATGWYNASFKLILVLLFIPDALNSAIFPLMSKYYISSKDSLKTLYEKIFTFMLLIGTPLGVGTTLLSDRIIPIIYGLDYKNSILILQILIWSVVLFFLRSLLERFLGANNMQRAVAKIFGSGALMNIILNVLLIPHYSYIGACLAAVGTELFILTFLIITAKKRIGYGISMKDFIYLGKVIFANFIMGFFIWNFTELNIYILILLSIVIYFSAASIINAVSKDEVRLIKSMVYFWKI